jgi:predicted TIM-barrel fold metal-dependent hydrolase
LHSEFTPMGRQIMHLLADYLGCPHQLNAVIEARNKESRSDYAQYCKNLFEDAKIEGLLVDDGFSELSVSNALPKNDFVVFEKNCPVPTRRVARIEPRFQEAVDHSRDFEDFVRRFDEAIERAVKEQGAIAFKSIIAYRTGLHIEEPTDTDVRKDYEISKATRKRGVKHIRDWYVRRVLAKCPELGGAALHLHCGMGDVDVVFDKCNPSQLYELLKDSSSWQTKIFLIHGGYPFSQEAAFFANALKNVYVDLSEMIPFASIGGAIDKTLQILDMAPPARVVFGSDGIVIPEVHWAGAKIGRKVLESVLGKFVELGVYDEDEAHKAARLILAENAKRVYKLSSW